MKRRGSLDIGLRYDLEQWWVAKTEEMKKAEAIFNSRQLFRLIKETSIKNPATAETISERDGTTIHYHSR